MRFFLLTFILSSIVACQFEKTSTSNQGEDLMSRDTTLDKILADRIAIVEKPAPNIDSILAGEDSSWVDLMLLMPKAAFEIRYATTNNFMELQVYDCPGCFTRLAVAKALMAAEAELDSQQLAFKFFDCYRPSRAQWALWNKMPDSRYVHPPKLGSMHSRGNALDLTIIDSLGQEWEMGTPFDYFGKEAYWSYQNHPQEVLENRKFLRTLMEKHGFRTIATEWWHFDYKMKRFPLSDMIWSCADSLHQH
jgi:D-alanyl-D-alanine dipeptidase